MSTSRPTRTPPSVRPLSPLPDEPDLGLFGPASVTWRLHADPMSGIAGLRALLLQALHPTAMAGVAQHSAFREDPWGRLFRTADYVGAVTYGTREQARRTAARVRGVHRRLGGGTDAATGREYRIEDPDLLLWVHCCLVDSFLSVCRRSGVPLAPGDADAYVAEQVQLAELVGVRPTGRRGLAVPSSAAELADYFAAMRPQLRATDEARAAARFVLLPPMPTPVALATPARPAWAGVAGLAFASLPGWARRLYRLPGLPTTDLATTAGLRALRLSLLALPASLREGPHLRQARARLAESA
ncbi:MAG: oxygenase MpaB family protein [Motilibacteraceae bacterium]